MSVTATELRQLARTLGTPGRSKLAPMANTGVTTPEMQAMADKLALPSAWAKLLPESPSECTPICLEAIEGQPAYSYLGTDADGNTGVFPLPIQVSAIAASPDVYQPEGRIVGNLLGQMYTQLDPTSTYVYRQWYFKGALGTSTGWI